MSILFYTNYMSISKNIQSQSWKFIIISINAARQNTKNLLIIWCFLIWWSCRPELPTVCNSSHDHQGCKEGPEYVLDWNSPPLTSSSSAWKSPSLPWHSRWNQNTHSGTVSKYHHFFSHDANTVIKCTWCFFQKWNAVKFVWNKITCILIKRGRAYEGR